MEDGPGVLPASLSLVPRVALVNPLGAAFTFTVEGDSSTGPISAFGQLDRV